MRTYWVNDERRAPKAGRAEETVSWSLLVAQGPNAKTLADASGAYEGAVSWIEPTTFFMVSAEGTGPCPCPDNRRPRAGKTRRTKHVLCDQRGWLARAEP